MNQTPYNLLYEIEVILFTLTQTENRAFPLERDSVIARDTENKYKLCFLGAKILRDIRINGGENIVNILEEEAAKETTFYNCDVSENLDRIMPPP